MVRIDISGTYDLECNDTDPIDDELVHEEGSLTSGNVSPNEGTITSSQYPGTSNGKLSKNGVAMSTDDALDTATDFLGPGYYEAQPDNSGRFVSADGNRQVRIGYNDITGAHAGAPHINFEFIGKGKHVSFHVYLM